MKRAFFTKCSTQYPGGGNWNGSFENTRRGTSSRKKKRDYLFSSGGGDDKSCDDLDYK